MQKKKIKTSELMRQKLEEGYTANYNADLELNKEWGSADACAITQDNLWLRQVEIPAKLIEKLGHI